MNPSVVGCLTDQSYVIEVDSKDEASQMIQCPKTIQWLAEQAAALGLMDTKIYYPKCPKPFLVPASFARGWSQSVEPLNQELAAVVQKFGISAEVPTMAKPVINSAIDFDWNAVMAGENPTYISQMKTQANLYVNAAVVSAQSNKPPSDLLNDTAHTLNDPDELIARCQYVINDGVIHAYSYEGWRWYNENDEWVRHRINLVSNVWNIQYLSRPCWMEEVLFAERVCV